MNLFKKKNSTRNVFKNIVELLIEVLIFFAIYKLFNINYIMNVSFERYLFIFLTIYVLIRDKYQNNLIWQDAKNIMIFYVVLFVISLVVRPMKELTFSKIISNFEFMFISSFIVLLEKKTIHTVFFKLLSNNVLIVGTGNHAQIIFETCNNNRYSLMNVKGFISCKDSKLQVEQEEVVIGNVVPYKELDNFIIKNNIDTVLVAVPQMSKEGLTQLTKDLRNKVSLIKYMPQINSMISYEARIEDYDGLLLICNREDKKGLEITIIKRTVDIFVGIIGCLLLVPLTFIIKFINKKNGDNDPVFFKQERIGLNGKKIVIYKFRSMIPNAEQVLEELMAKDENIKNEYLTNKKLVNDPRITKVGKLIRKTSLDEFPQFINILKGDMSLVGPRPYLFREKDDMGIFYESIISTKPGVTGMWQVSGRNDVSFERRVRLDEYYAKNQSFWLDFTIVIKTIKAVLASKGAR